MTLRAPAIGTDTDSAETFRLAMGGLWVPTSALNARTGVTSTPVLTGTGNFTATVSAFTAVIDGTSNSLQGCYPVANDAPATITIGAANTQPRIDLISLQIQDTNYDGSGQTRCIPVVTAGTPAGSPVAPAAPANSLPLWTVPVAANATSVAFSSATAAYQRTAAAGGIVPVGVSTDKPATVNGVAYRHRLDVTATSGGTSPLESSTDGITYTPVFDPTPYQYTWTTFATVWNGTIGNGTLVMRYIKIGRLVNVRLSMNAGSTTTFAGGASWNFSLPFPSAISAMLTGIAVAYCGNTNPAYYGSGYVTGSTCTAVFTSASAFVNATLPAAWSTTNNNSLDMTFFYESTT